TAAAMCPRTLRVEPVVGRSSAVMVPAPPVYQWFNCRGGQIVRNTGRAEQRVVVRCPPAQRGCRNRREWSTYLTPRTREGEQSGSPPEEPPIPASRGFGQRGQPGRRQRAVEHYRQRQRVCLGIADRDIAAVERNRCVTC